VLRDPPDVLAHNLETVRRLTPEVRDRRASYDGSLALLRQARAEGPAHLVTKSSIMLGLGESETELSESFADLRAAGVDLLTLGQYLRPTAAHRPVSEYVPPERFEQLRRLALDAGFAGVEAGPLVRSSYHADEVFARARPARVVLEMAKKAQKKLEDDQATNFFEFPEFDVKGFIDHEFEQSYATAFALIFAVALAVVSFGIDRGLSGYSQPTLQWVLPLAISVGAIIFSPFFLQRLRSGAKSYTRGDWASVILLEVFGWLGFWFLLSDVFHIG
jgi:hypothetical protein